VLSFATALLLTAVPAHAVTSAQKMAQAADVKRQVEALDNRVEVAGEKYNLAADKHSKLLAQRRSAAARLAKAQKRLNKLEKHLNTRAGDMYRNGPLGFLDVLLGARTFDQFARTWDVLKQLNVDDANYIAETKDARAEATAAHNELTAKERAAAKQESIMASNRSYVLSELSKRKQEYRGLEAEVTQLQQQEAAAQLASARAQARSMGHSGSTADDNYPTPSIPAHGDVVAYARSRIGCPYVWAASGPRAFDCSGLAMWCYGKIGISLPHSSAEQYNSGPHVSKSDLQPGDLVFFGSSIHHVGIYIGGGDMIEAPYTGARVRVASAFRSDYHGACRPR
jgi:peptidoglycan DL-endopeptidase CwlO